MRNTIIRVVERLEREGEGERRGRLRKRGAIKLAVGLLAFSLGVAALVILFWMDVKLRFAKTACGAVTVMGLFGVLMGMQQVVFGRSWTEAPLAVRILILAIGIPAIFAAILFGALSLAK